MIYVQKIQGISKDEGGSRHRILHSSAYELLNYAIEKEYKEKVNKLTMRSMEHGKPYFVEKNENGEEILSNIKFNLSHSGEMAVCVLSRFQVGIDIEKIRKYHPKVADRILSEEEWEVLQKSENKDKDFIKFWTLKEAYGKYTGKGLGTEFKKVKFRWTEAGDILCSDEKVALFQYELESEYILSLCVEKREGQRKEKIIKWYRQEEEENGV